VFWTLVSISVFINGKFVGLMSWFLLLADHFPRRACEDVVDMKKNVQKKLLIRQMCCFVHVTVADVYE